MCSKVYLLKGSAEYVNDWIVEIFSTLDAALARRDAIMQYVKDHEDKNLLKIEVYENNELIHSEYFEHFDNVTDYTELLGAHWQKYIEQNNCEISLNIENILKYNIKVVDKNCLGIDSLSYYIETWEVSS
jgi:hypothetical protein